MKLATIALAVLVASTFPLHADSDISNFSGNYAPVTSDPDKDGPQGIRVTTSPNKEWGGVYLDFGDTEEKHFSFRNRRFEFTADNAHLDPDKAVGICSISPNRIVFRSLYSDHKYTDNELTISGRLIRTKTGLRLSYTVTWRYPHRKYPHNTFSRFHSYAFRRL